MHDVLISHLEGDGPLALQVALVLERAGYSTREHELRAGADPETYASRAIVPIVSARCVDVAADAPTETARRMQLEIVSARAAGKPVLRLLSGLDRDPLAAQPPCQSNGDTTLRLPDQDVASIHGRLVAELASRGAMPGEPRSERIAELERRLAGGQPAALSWPALFMRTLYFAAVGLLLLSLDPFGASSSSAKYSQDLINQVFGAWYPSGAREETTVVLLTDDGLEGQREAWPASYRLHARVLNAILAHAPKAVMVDVWFHDQREDPSLAQLERALARYHDRGIPVYAAASSESPTGGIRTEIAGRVTPVPVPKVDDAQDRANRRYPLFVTLASGQRAETAALRLYKEVARPAFAPLPFGAQPHAMSPPRWHRVFGDPLEVVWGTTSAPVNEKSVYCAFERAPLDVVRARMFAGESIKSECPYPATLLAGDLLKHSADSDVAGMLSDKVVFYGAYIQGASDLIDPPTHQAMAGVYLHPMAYDNLLTFGAEYVRRAEPGGTRYVAARATEIIMLFMITGVVVVFRNRASIAARYPRTRRFVEHRVAYGLVTVFPLAIAAAVGYVSFARLNLAPLNWIGHLSLAGTLAAYPYERHIAVMRRLGMGVFVPRKGVVRKRQGSIS